MKAKRSISGKILVTTIFIVMLLSAVLVSLMSRSMMSLTETILSNVLPSMTKTASQSVEGNIHVLADRMIAISDNEIMTNKDSGESEKLEVLKKAASGIEFMWLGLYSTEGELYVGEDSCPESLQDRQIYSLMEETQNLVVDDVDSSKGELELAVGKPVLDTEGEILYYLVGSYKYEVLNDVLNSINISANGEAFIVNADGQVMGNRNTDLIFDRTDLAEYTGSEELESKVVSGQTGIMTIKQGKDVKLASYVPVNGTNWYLAILVPSSDFMGPARDSIIMGMILTAVMIIFAILIIVGFSSKIRKSLKIVTSRIELLEKGDLKTPADIIQTRDETQVLSVALNSTISGINGYISQLSKVLSSISEGNFDVSIEEEFQGDFIQIKDALEKIIVSLNTMLRSVQESSGEVLHTAKTVSEGAAMVHNGSTEQSNSLMVLTEETKAIEENIREVNDNTKRAGELMQKAKESLGIGDENMKNLLEAMEDIHENAVEINKINKLLEDIAQQTNILALNASVEASRAGEMGKGFAVVASEVRSLAAQSTESAHHVTEVITSSQYAIQHGLRYAKQAADSFADIESVSNEISDITDRLGRSVAVQKDSLENMSEQIEQINNFAQKNLDASFESATASQKLNRQAEQLQELSERFRLRRIK
ncbi:MAG: methyl-accepting chemotaxis protein [Lachnospiraceae bacterium]|nr:methyl-accepting chemotaxis protein [Lachnospiraceae bacterium]